MHRIEVGIVMIEETFHTWFFRIVAVFLHVFSYKFTEVDVYVLSREFLEIFIEAPLQTTF